MSREYEVTIKLKFVKRVEAESESEARDLATKLLYRDLAFNNHLGEWQQETSTRRLK